MVDTLLIDRKSLNLNLLVGYENALMYITQSINKIMNGDVLISDLVISKLLRQSSLDQTHLLIYTINLDLRYTKNIQLRNAE
jgi:hypothetical protein